MAKLTKKQIDELKSKSYQFAPLRLNCDGYEIDLKEYRYKNTLRVILYVNGMHKGCWLTEGSEHPESKLYQFMRIRVKKNILKPKCRKMETVTLKARDVDFSSIGQALRHLNKVCDSVELINDDANAIGDK